MNKITLVDYINMNAETNEPTRFEVQETEIKKMVDLRGMRIYEKDDFVKHLEMKIKNNDDLEEILKNENLYNDLEASASNSALLSDWEETSDTDVIYNDNGIWYLDNLEDMETTEIWEYWDNGNWITRVIEDNELEIEEIEEEINIEGAIEHLQEMGKVSTDNCKNVSKLHEELEEKGYITKFQITDREYLVLIEKIIDIDEIAENLIGNSIDDVIEIFGNYSYKGITEIIVNEINVGFYSHTAYANHKIAPEILMLVDEEGMITRADVKC